MPIAESTRPQLGSSPWMAHLRRLLRAMERPTSTASSSLAAPTTSIRMSLEAPSASPISWRARSSQTARTASANSSYSGRDSGGAGGEQQHGVVGGHAAVGVDPVEGGTGRGAQRRVERRPASRSASVVRTTSMVARPGASMPAPLAMPPTVQPSRLDDGRLVHGVGGLDGDGGLLAAVRGELRRRPSSMPGSSLSIGSRRPISPVEATAISPALWPRTSAAFSAVAWVSWKPERARTGVGATGVEDDGGDLAALEDLLGPEDGRGLDAVGGEDARGGAARARC